MHGLLWRSLMEDNSKTNKVAVRSLILQCHKDLLEISNNAFVVSDALAALE
jgi:hypothetical protein